MSFAIHHGAGFISIKSEIILDIYEFFESLFLGNVLLLYRFYPNTFLIFSTILVIPIGFDIRCQPMTYETFFPRSFLSDLSDKVADTQANFLTINCDNK